MTDNNNDAIKLKKGDLSTFEQIYDRFYEKIYSFIFLKIGNQTKTEDFTSDVFLRFVDFAKNNEIDNVNAILYRIARNIIIDDSRKTKEEYVGDEYLDNVTDENSINNLENDFVNNENLLKIIGELKDDYRNVIVLYYMNEMSIHEIAIIFEKNEGAVRVMLSRAIASVKEKLKK